MKYQNQNNGRQINVSNVMHQTTLQNLKVHILQKYKYQILNKKPKYINYVLPRFKI